MKSEISRSLWRILAALAFVAGLTAGIAAQGEVDPDPNSPIPVILTRDDSTRALAQPEGAKVRGNLSRTGDQAFEPESKIDIYVTNLALMPGEGSNAFRVYAEDGAGHTFRFPVVGIDRLSREIYSVTISLADEIGYWPAPSADGDLMLYLTWRGLASNRVRLGYGQMGGSLKSGASDRPAPFSLTQDKAKLKAYAATLAPEYVGYRWSGDRMRFLEQAAFGQNTALDNRIRRIGIRTWLAEQFNPTTAYPSLINPYPNQPLKPTNAPADCDNEQTVVPDVPVTCFRDTYSMYQPQTWFFREAFYSDAQLRHRVAWALAQIWVTSGVDVQQGRHMVEYHKILSNNAFGNYRNLMQQMTLNPTMGQYLDMAISTKTNPNENYAREIMQLFSVGLFMLNTDGTVQTDGNGPIPTYDQNVVNNLTKVLTGWGFCNTAAACPNLVAGTVNYIDPLLFNRNNHDLTAKTLLSYPGSTTTNIPACTGCTGTAIDTYANNSLQQALDNIFNHPNLGPFVSKIMIQHMITSDPTPAYVQRVASVFNDNGNGVRGDMKAVVKAILLDPEARGDFKTDPNFGKLREPVQLTTNFARAMGVRSADGLSQTDGYLTGRGEFTGMGQTPFMSPTVFNFFPPDYVIPGTATIGPEFAIMTTGTTVQRSNFINRMVLPGGLGSTTVPIAVSSPNSPNGLSFDFSDLQALAAADTTSSLLLDELNRRFLHGTMSSQMKSTIQTAVNGITVSNPPTATQTLSRVQQAVYLVATSSQYQVQR